MSFRFNSQLRIYLLCCFVSLGGFMYGYDSGVITALLAMPAFREQYGWDSNRSANIAVVPVSSAAAFVASFASGFIADKLGRKKLFYVATILHEIGCVVELAGHSQISFFVGRILTGFGIGIFSMLIPLYQSEIAKPDNRGRLITIYQIFVTLGFFVAFWLGYGTFLIPGDASWRIPLGIQLVAGAIMLFGIYFIPESPRWLIYKERNAEALDILAHLRSKGNEHDVEVQMEFTGIVQDVSFDKMAYKQRFLSLLRKGNDNNRKRTLLGMGVHTFTQLSGINAILFYLPHILGTSGITETYSALMGNGIGGAVNFGTTLFVVLYIDKWDRRKILIVGAISMALSMIAITAVSAVYGEKLVKKTTSGEDDTSVTSFITHISASHAILVLLCIFIACFALSWGPIGWIYPAEIYPQMIRANAMGVTTACSYFFSLFVSLISPIMFDNIKWGTYLFFGVMCIIMAIVVNGFYPETRGRSLEEIQLIFSGALIDQRPDAHHPATAAEALLQLEQIQHRDKRDQMAGHNKFPFGIPSEWNEMVVSSPHNVTRALNPRTSRGTATESHHSASISSNISRHTSSSSIELSIQPPTLNTRKLSTKPSGRPSSLHMLNGATSQQGAFKPQQKSS